MSVDWWKDVSEMHAKNGFYETMDGLGSDEIAQFLEFREKFLEEELRELRVARLAGDWNGVVDALVDLIVVAIGTVDLLGVDAGVAWDAVHSANMAKERGIKPTRPNPFGFPDLIKPEGWKAPSHENNIGFLGNSRDDDGDEDTN